MYSIVILSMPILIISGPRNLKTGTKNQKLDKIIWNSNKNNESSKMFTNICNSSQSNTLQKIGRLYDTKKFNSYRETWIFIAQSKEKDRYISKSVSRQRISVV